MTTYVYHVPYDPADEQRIVAMVAALEEFLGDSLVARSCLELTTTRQAVADVIGVLFDVHPELRCDEGPILPEVHLDTLIDHRIELDLAQAEYEKTLGLLGPDFSVAVDAAPRLEFLTCPRCGGLIPEKEFDQHMRHCGQSEGTIVQELGGETCVKEPEEVRQYDPAGNPLPTFEETQEDIASMRNCPECKMLFHPDKDDQVYCGKKCSGRAYARQYYAKKKASGNGNGNGNGHEPATGAREPETPAADDEPGQVYDWCIEKNGKEVQDISALLDREKLQPGDRVHHLHKGWHEVVCMEDGALGVVKVQR